MTKADGDLAVAERRARGDEEYRRAEFIATCTKPLVGDETVADHWTDEEIEQIREQVFGDHDPGGNQE
jgi:hypothetical protein